MILTVDDFSAWAQSIGGIATAIALGVVAWQAHLTNKQYGVAKRAVELSQEEIDTTLRPWLGIFEVGLNMVRQPHMNRPEPNGALFYYKNFGRTPARIVRIRSYSQDTEINEEDLRSSELKSEPQSLIYPGQDNNYYVGGLISNNRFFGFLLEYTYGIKKTDEILSIVQYDAIIGKFRSICE